MACGSDPGGSGSPLVDGDAGASDASSPDATSTIDSEWSEPLLVERVIDGDTIVVTAEASVLAPDGVSIAGQHVRLLGINAPEIAHSPGEVSDCYGDEATEYVRTRISGRLVELGYDAPSNLRDPYNRLLAYVKDDQGVLNEDLLALGYARVYRGSSHPHYAAYLALEAQAKKSRLGLWACPR